MSNLKFYENLFYWEWYAEQIKENKRSSHLISRKPKRDDIISSSSNSKKEQKLDLSELNETLETINDTISSEGSYTNVENQNNADRKQKCIQFKRHGMDFGSLAGVRQRYPGLSYEAMFHIIQIADQVRGINPLLTPSTATLERHGKQWSNSEVNTYFQNLREIILNENKSFVSAKK